MKTKITEAQYLTARNKLADAQTESQRASRAGDQVALDAASDKAAKALAVIADYKAQR